MIIIPNSVDLTPEGEIVIPNEEYLSDAYIDNVNYTAEIQPSANGLQVQFYGEDDSYLDQEQVKQAILLFNEHLR